MISRGVPLKRARNRKTPVPRCLVRGMNGVSSELPDHACENNMGRPANIRGSTNQNAPDPVSVGSLPLDRVHAARRGVGTLIWPDPELSNIRAL